MRARFFLLLICFVAGSGYGFYAHLFCGEPKDPKKVEIEATIEEAMAMSFENQLSSSKGGDTYMAGARIPLFKFGKLKTEITAEEIIWNAEGPVELKKVLVREIALDGKTVMAEISGDNGVITISEANEVQKIRVWGNTKMRRYVVDEPTK